MVKEKKEIVREEKPAGGSLLIEQDLEGNQKAKVVTHTEVRETTVIRTEEKK